MDFGTALEYLKEGYKVTCKGWGNAHIALYEPRADDTVNMPYIYMVMGSGAKVVWIPTHLELLSYDWKIYRDYNIRDIDDINEIGDI